MKKPILERYSSMPDGRIVLDVAFGKVDDLFEHFDRIAPYHKKDLAYEVVDYLLDCVREIGRIPFMIRFSFTQEPDEALQARVIKGVHEYFFYRSELERSKAGRIVRVSLLMVIAGLLLLALTIQLRELLSPGASLPVTLVYEGFTIIAWIIVWEAVAGFFVKWFPARRFLRLCKRLSKAPIAFYRVDQG